MPSPSDKPPSDATPEITEVSAPDSASAFDRTPIQLDPIESLQILNEHGEVDEALDPGLDDAQMHQIYEAMVRSRAFDARMLLMQRQGKMGTFAPNLGQEATMIGQVQPLTQRDWFCPSYRSFGAQIWRGWSMERLMLLWAGYHEGFPPPDGVNDLPFSIVIGAHVLPAVGIAMAAKIKGDDTVVAVNFGDGASAQGAVSEAMNFAAVTTAPVVFFCENNGWAISTPVELEAADTRLAVRGAGFGIPSIRVDGNDILAMVTAARDATDRARRGGGPTLIEAVTFRMSLHTTADDPTVYRDQSLVEEWEPRCPIKRLNIYMKRRGLLDDDGISSVAEAADTEVRAARDTFERSAMARPREVFDYLYAAIPPELAAQQAEYLDRLTKKGIG
jgi:TPP-dependent pyruvate/acetoin dehydrogenase alpha subunit